MQDCTGLPLGDRNSNKQLTPSVTDPVGCLGRGKLALEANQIPTKTLGFGTTSISG